MRVNVLGTIKYIIRHNTYLICMCTALSFGKESLSADYARRLFMTGLFLSSENRLILHIRVTK